MSTPLTALPAAPDRSDSVSAGRPALAPPPRNEGHGRRLTAAFEALEAFPVLVESRNRVLRL